MVASRSTVWLNRHGLVRVVWRLPIFLVLLVAFVFGALLAAAVGLAPFQGGDVRMSLGEGPLPVQVVTYAAGILGVFAASVIAVRFLDRRPPGGLGLGLHSGWLRQFVFGLVTGTILIGSVVVILLAAGAIHFDRSDLRVSELLASFGLSLLVCIGTGFFEELLFRGYLLQVLAEGFGDFLDRRLGSGREATIPEHLRRRGGMVAASILLATAFGLAHLGNEGATAVGALVTGVGGLVLSIAYFRTRSLWLPVGMHVSWNFVLGWVFSLPVSGELPQAAPFAPSLDGPAWLSGASFGPEGSMVTVIGLVCVGIFFVRSKQLKATADAVRAFPPPEVRRPNLPPDGPTSTERGLAGS